MVGLLAAMEAAKKRKLPAGVDRATDPGGGTPAPGAVTGRGAPVLPSGDPARQLSQTAKRAMNPEPTGLLRHHNARPPTGNPETGETRRYRAAGERSVAGHAADRVPGVSGRLTGLLREDNPYLQQARSRAARAANRRGVMNSSIAAGAGEEAAIAAALPIAQSDAQIAAGERALESQEFQQYRDHRVQMLMQQRGLDFTAAQNQADRDLRDLMQRRDHRVQQLMQERGLTHDAAQRQADRELQDMMQTRQIGSTERIAEAQRELQDLINQRNIRSQELMQERGLAHDAAQRQAQRELQSSLAAAERKLRASMQERQIASNEKVQKANRELQDSINKRNIRSQELMQERGLSHDAAQREAQRQLQSDISAKERQLRAATEAARNQVQRETLKSSQQIATMNAQSRNYGTYQQSVDRINANAELPAEERAEQLKQAKQTYDSTTSAQQQISGVEYDWPTYDAG